MERFELKIPPVLLVVIFAVLMWAASGLLPQLYIPLSLRIAAFAALAAIGAWIAIAGVRSFKMAETTVNPTTPNASSSLVTSGIYQRTRNPMYVGLLLLLVGWGVFLASLYALALTVGFVVYMNRFQIRPEERALESLFGEEVLSYQRQVRRWL
ncbi:MAG: isoprenylcysteine carboxylmethyltransferase family protein [Motiliproteus sp.]